jgi:hypothetical protein
VITWKRRNWKSRHTQVTCYSDPCADRHVFCRPAQSGLWEHYAVDTWHLRDLPKRFDTPSIDAAVAHTGLPKWVFEAVYEPEDRAEYIRQRLKGPTIYCEPDDFD